MAPRKLAAVPDPPGPEEDEAEEVSTPALSVKAAAGTSRLALLTALRDNIAGEIDAGVQARDLASLSRRLMEIISEIETLEQREAEDGGGAGNAEDEEFDAASV